MKVRYDYDEDTHEVLRQYSVENSDTGGVYFSETTQASCYLSEDLDEVIIVPQAPSAQQEWDWDTKEWVLDLAGAKANKWAEIKAARDAQESGTFTYDTDIYQCDVDSRANILSYASRAQREDPNWNVDWRLADNTYVNLDGGQMIEMHDAMNEHIKTTHATAKDLWEDIQAAATVEAVEAIVWP